MVQMMRRFEFRDDKASRTWFRLLYEAFISRGSANREQRQTKDDHRSEARILKALKAISVPHPDAPDPDKDSPDTRLRVLQRGGGIIELEQPDWARLQKYVDETQWSSSLVDVVIALQDAMDVAEKVDENPRELKSV